MSKYMKLPLSFGARNVGIADTGDYDGVVEIKDADRKVIFQNWNGDDFDEERARRIAACVNVCAGVPIEILEATGASLIPPDEPYSAIKQQRDKLLEALKELVQLAELGDADQDKHGWHPELETFRSIITEVEAAK